jgi:hypothetical protein
MTLSSTSLRDWLDVGVAKSHVAMPHLMRRLIENDERRRAEHPQPRHQDRDSSYLDFLATHPLVFFDATNPLEVDS